MDNSIDWEKIAANFPVTNQYIWLNSAGYFPAGKHITNAVNEFLQTYAGHGIKNPGHQFSTIHSKIKSVLAGLLGCSPDDVALIHNTAEGINFISHGLKLAAGDEILLLEQEYPSNIYPWEHWEKKGITLSSIPNAFTQDDFIKNLKNTITKRTKAIALSAVHWCTGMPFPLEEINKICKENNAELVVDISQGAGNVPIALDDWGISFVPVLPGNGFKDPLD